MKSVENARLGVNCFERSRLKTGKLAPPTDPPSLRKPEEKPMLKVLYFSWPYDKIEINSNKVKNFFVILCGI